MISFARRLAILAVTASTIALAGCANPGPPKPPSLNIPAVTTDLKAARYGNTVELQFTLPQRTSEGLLLRSGAIKARLCRAVETGTCQPLAGAVSFTAPMAPKALATMKDSLPAILTSGPARLLTYRVELLNGAGRSAGFSDAAYTASGTAPKSVEAFRAEGSRLGVLLRWREADPDAKILVMREDLNWKPENPQVPLRPRGDKFTLDQSHTPRAQPALVTLDASADTSAATHDVTLDTTAVPDTPYHYTSQRRRSITLHGHMLDIWSEASAVINFTLHDAYPPPSPTALSAAGYSESTTQVRGSSYAVDLIWEPVQDEQLSGYRVYREELRAGTADPVSNKAGRKQLLTTTPIKLPAFHDTSASGSRRYRYSVTSVDLKGNESEALTVVLEPQVF